MGTACKKNINSSYEMGEAVNAAQQAKIAIEKKKKGEKPKKINEGSLHKWFKGSKSKDGKGGWVNVVTGGTCASDEPGEGTPKCVSSAKRASMSKKERLSAARRKKKADPNQQSKRGAAKPTYVATDKPKKKKMKEEFISLPLQLEVPQSDAEFRLGLMFRESLEQDRGMLFIFEDTDYHSFHMKNTFIPLDIAFINEEGRIESIKELSPHSVIPVYPDGKIRYAIEVNRGWFAENNVVVGDAILEEGCEQCGESCDDCECECHNTITEVKDRKGKGSGKKDACYHKVKSRYSVWPSAYASGALVKCRKVGAANWGNSRKEEVEYETKVYKTPHYRWRDALAEHHRKDEDGNTIPHEDDIKEGHYGSAVNKIPAELDKAVALHKSQAERLRAAGVGDDKNCGCGQTPCKTYGKKKKMKEEMSASDMMSGKGNLDNPQSPTIFRSGTSTNAKGEKIKFSTRTNKKTGKTTVTDKFGTRDLPKMRMLKNSREFSVWRQELDEKCWPGYEKKGMKTMFGKRYPNCVKKSKSKTRKEEIDYDGVIESAADVLLKTATGGDKKRKNDPNVTPSMLQRFYATSTGAGSIYEKKMTKKDIKKRDEIADSMPKKDFKDRYGDDAENVMYGAATNIVKKQKKKKKKKVLSASYNMDKGVTESDLIIQDWNVDDIKYTEIETVDVIKAKPLKESKAKLAIGTAKFTQKLFKTMGRAMKSGKRNPLTGNVFAKPGSVKFSRTFA